MSIKRLIFHFIVLAMVAVCQTKNIDILPSFNAVECCTFNSDICGFTSHTWIWSGSKRASYVPPFAGNCLWADFPNAKATSPPQTVKSNSTILSVAWYTTGMHATIDVYFQEDGYPENKLGHLGIAGVDTTEWRNATIQPQNLCSSGDSCTGNFYFIAVVSISTFEVAIDNACIIT